jgi:hypothetical protein
MRNTLHGLIARRIDAVAPQLAHGVHSIVVKRMGRPW